MIAVHAFLAALSKLFNAKKYQRSILKRKHSGLFLSKALISHIPGTNFNEVHDEA